MGERQKQLTDLNAYIEGIDENLTKILKNFEWDRRYLLESKNLEMCKYDPNHKIPPAMMEVHEKKCLLKMHGYTDGDILLPVLPGNNHMTHVKLGREEITQIINAASNKDPSFKKGTGPQGLEPMTLERLQCVYTADERRAIHDAVVAAAPACHDLSDLALLSTNGEEQKSPKAKSRMEVLAELRDMKRRRTKYRVAAKTRNYSDVLRDVIKTQMEIYHKEPQDDIASNKMIEDKNNTRHNRSVSNSFTEVSYKEKEEFHRDHKSKERVRDDFRNRYKYIERHQDEGRSKQTFKETGNDAYKYDRGYKDSDMKYHSRYKEEEYRKRSYSEREYKDEKGRSEPNFRSGGVIKIEECHRSVDYKGYGFDSRLKQRSEEKRFEGYHRERNDYSDYNAKDGYREGSHRRYYDTFDKEDMNYERRKRNKYN